MEVLDDASAGLRLADLVARFGGELRGDPNLRVRRVASLANAGPGDISFLAQARYKRLLRGTRASALIVAPAVAAEVSLPMIVCAEPYAYFAQVSQLLNPVLPLPPGIHPNAVVDPSARLGDGVAIGPFCSVGAGCELGDGVVLGAACHLAAGCVIGAGSLFHARVTCYAGTRVGARCIVHSGAVLGADGFGFAPKDGRWLKIPQLGALIIGDDVEIGANTTVDRGALDPTVIGDGVKLDNQIQIGHNVQVGAHTAMAGCVGVAGSAQIGRRCTIGGGAIVLGHLSVADDVNISAATVVTKSIIEPGTYSGAYPFERNAEWREHAVWLRNIDKLVERIKSLEQQLKVESARGSKS